MSINLEFCNDTIRFVKSINLEFCNDTIRFVMSINLEFCNDTIRFVMSINLEFCNDFGVTYSVTIYLQPLPTETQCALLH